MDLDLQILSFKDFTFKSRKSLKGFANPNPNLFESAALLLPYLTLTFFYLLLLPNERIACKAK